MLDSYKKVKKGYKRKFIIGTNKIWEGDYWGFRSSIEYRRIKRTKGII